MEQERHHPQILQDTLPASYRRLGLYAEALLARILQAQADIQLLAQHTAIHQQVPTARQNGRATLGELDFVWRDRQSGRVHHWELAVKLYLYLPGPDDGQAHLERFVGLQQRDTLALKAAKLSQRQLPLSRHPQAAQALGVAADTAAALFKGWLFYPLAGAGWQDYQEPATATRLRLNPAHAKGWWLTRSAFMRRLAAGDPLRWRIVPRLQWLSPQYAVHADTQDSADLAARLRAYFDADDGQAGAGHGRPGLLVTALAPAQPPCGQDAPYYREVHRGFVVADEWGKGPSPTDPMDATA